MAVAVGAAVAMVACCALWPLLLAAGGLGVLGGLLRSPWVITAAVVLAAAAVTMALRRRGPAADSGQDDCCPPTPQDTSDGATRVRPRDPVEPEGTRRP